MYTCKNCDSNEYVKAGFVKGEQRYKCKKCGCQIVPTRQKGRSKQEKLLAVWMYAHGIRLESSPNFLGKRWVKSFAEKNYSKPAPIDDSVMTELDEISHFMCAKKTNLALESLLPDNKAAHHFGIRRMDSETFKKCISN